MNVSLRVFASLSIGHRDAALFVYLLTVVIVQFGRLSLKTSLWKTDVPE
jgi:hypothetical protein